MNLNITSIWEDFYKESKFDSLEEVLAFVQDKYGIDEDEAKELLYVSDLALAEYFEHDKLFRKKRFKKELDRSAHDILTALFINGVFFGMFLSDFLKWKFPKK